MNLKRLKDDGLLAWNAAGKFIELFVIFILTFLITILMGLAALLDIGRSWVEGGHKLPAWLKPSKLHPGHRVWTGAGYEWKTDEEISLMRSQGQEVGNRELEVARGE